LREPQELGRSGGNKDGRPESSFHPLQLLQIVMRKKNLRSRENEWYIPRSYSHFDAPVSEENAVKYIENTSNVYRHSFWPFIRYKKQTKRFWQFQASQQATPHSKSDDYKLRPIMYSAHMDSHIYSYYSNVLLKKYESALAERNVSHCVLAYRKLNKSNIEFAKTCFDAIKGIGACTVLCFDVKGFFDTLDHGYLKEKWMQLLGTSKLPDDHFRIFRAITHYSYVEKEEIIKKYPYSKGQNTKRICSAVEFRDQIRKPGLVIVNTNSFGIPQGSPISSTLANIYMLDFDQVLYEQTKSAGGQYWRYADDILIIIPSGKSMEIKTIVENELKKTKLQLSIKKTEEAVFNN
jgi:hypothetical protein